MAEAHEPTGNMLSTIDKDLVRLLKTLSDSAVQNKRPLVLAMMADHGYDAGAYAASPFGSLESRLPTFFLAISKDLLSQDMKQALRENQHALVTPYDIYLTLASLGYVFKNRNQSSHPLPSHLKGTQKPYTEMGKTLFARTGDRRCDPSLFQCPFIKSVSPSAECSNLIEDMLVSYINQVIPHDRCYTVSALYLQISSLEIEARSEDFACRADYDGMTLSVLFTYAHPNRGTTEADIRAGISADPVLFRGEIHRGSVSSVQRISIYRMDEAKCGQGTFSAESTQARHSCLCSMGDEGME